MKLVGADVGVHDAEEEQHDESTEERHDGSAAELTAVARVDADRLEARRGGALEGGDEQKEDEEEVHEGEGYWLIVTVAEFGDVML